MIEFLIAWGWVPGWVALAALIVQACLGRRRGGAGRSSIRNG